MNWNEYALSIAEVVARKSKDPWKKVGCVLLRHDNSVASVGYNGFPPHAEEDWSDRDERRKFVIHAEQNALRYVRPNECRLLACTLLPCGNCLRMISAYGITEVVYREHYAYDDTAIEIADRFGIRLFPLPAPSHPSSSEC
jgi:dCMP deaminase